MSGAKPVVISQPKVIDSAVHVWSDGQPPYPWEAVPPEELQSSATHEALADLARDAGVAGALIVQPSVHKFDHSYVTAALRAHPHFYRGMLLANLCLEPAAAVTELERLHAEGTWWSVLGTSPFVFCVALVTCTCGDPMRPCVLQAATLCTPGCNPMCPRLRPCVLQASSACGSTRTSSPREWTRPSATRCTGGASAGGT